MPIPMRAQMPDVVATLAPGSTIAWLT